MYITHTYTIHVYAHTCTSASTVLGSGWLLTLRVSSSSLVACLNQILWKAFRAAADMCHGWRTRVHHYNLKIIPTEGVPIWYSCMVSWTTSYTKRKQSIIHYTHTCKPICTHFTYGAIMQYRISLNRGLLQIEAGLVQRPGLQWVN